MKTKKWRCKMLAGIEITKRESLTQEILCALGQWPEIERNVFSRSHYQGQTVEAISRSLQMDVEEIHRILQHCDRRLHASLRNLLQTGSEAHSLPGIGTARPAA
jgi:DNA-directed RNA polymerase specialized sigma24 family protein